MGRLDNHGQVAAQLVFLARLGRQSDDNKNVLICFSPLPEGMAGIGAPAIISASPWSGRAGLFGLLGVEAVDALEDVPEAGNGCLACQSRWNLQYI